MERGARKIGEQRNRAAIFARTRFENSCERHGNVSTRKNEPGYKGLIFVARGTRRAAKQYLAGSLSLV